MRLPGRHAQLRQRQYRNVFGQHVDDLVRDDLVQRVPDSVGRDIHVRRDPVRTGMSECVASLTLRNARGARADAAKCVKRCTLP
jgi:hypothetical protein